MSTVVYGGYRFHGNVFDLSAAVSAVRRKVAVLAERDYASLIAERLCSIIDAESIQGNTPSIKAAYIAAARVVFQDVQEQKRSARRNPEIDFDFDMQVFPLTRYREILVRTSTERDWLHLIDEDPRFESFDYDDRADRPDSITAKDWDKRRRRWHACDAFSNYMGGFKIALSPSLLTADIGQVADNLPPWDRRIEIMARKHAHKEAFALPQFDDLRSPDRIFRAAMAVEDFLLTDGSEIFSRYKDSAQTKLIPNSEIQDVLLREREESE